LKKDTVFEAKFTKIDSQFRAILERARNIERNSLDVQSKLEEIYRKALADLKLLTRKKINVLKGDVKELERQRNEMHSLQEFLEYEKAGINAMQFILDWNHFLNMKESLHNFSYFKESIETFPDIRINGAIQVCADQSSYECLVNDGRTDFRPKAPPRVREATSPNGFSTLTLNEPADIRSKGRRPSNLFTETLKNFGSNQAVALDQ
jgi:hypothetical protein